MLGGSAYGAIVHALDPRLNVVTSLDSPQAHRHTETSTLLAAREHPPFTIHARSISL